MKTMDFNRHSTVRAAKHCSLVAAIFLTTAMARGQTIITNFAVLNFNDANALGNGFTPPDTMGCAGTNQFVEFINGCFAVYNKAGVRQSLVTDSNFWASAGIAPAILAAGLSNPRIIYDAGSGRWFASEITVDNTGNKILLARSDSSNPGGIWRATNFLANTGFGDFDTLGVDSQGVYVAVNNFTNGITGGFTGVSFFSVPKADLMASPPTLARLTRFDNISDQTYGFALQGVNNPDAGPGHGVIIAIDNAAYNYFDRTTITNASGYPATLSTTPVRIHSAYDSNPNPATQPGGNTVDGGDDRFSAAVRQVGNYIVMANVFLNGSKDAVHWIVFNETNNTVVNEGIISDPNFDFTYPSIAISHSGKILMAFNRIGTTAPAGDISIYAALGGISNGVATMGSPFLLKQGTVSNFAMSFDSAPYRWGDYSTTMFDPTDENLVWTIQEIPISSSAWGTQVTLISLDTNRPTLNFSLNGSTATLSWPLSADPAYVLESSTVLPNSAWTTVTGWPQVININQRVVTMTVTGPALYFRLRK